MKIKRSRPYTFGVQEFLAQIIYGNSLQAYLEATAIFLALLVALLFIKSKVSRKFDSIPRWMRDEQLAHFIAGLVQNIRKSTLAAVALYIALRYLSVSNWIERGSDYFIVIAITLQTLGFADHLLNFLIPRALPKNEHTARYLIAFSRIFIWTTALLLALSNLGYNVTSAIAGLGIGGIAVALAAQNILGDLFSSFVILVSRPFEVGDVIDIGGDRGTVLSIGLKTTQIRSQEGELLVVPNSDLTRIRIRNFKNLPTKKVDLRFRAASTTPILQLERIPSLVDSALHGMAGIRFDHCKCDGPGDFGILFSATFFVNSPTGIEVHSKQTEAYIKILKVFEDSQIRVTFNASPDFLR